jgi:guanylate kinase
MKLCAVASVLLAAAVVSGASSPGLSTSRRALQELHLPALVSNTGRSEREP